MLRDVGAYLFARSRGRTAPVKTFLMDQSIVVGVGNIYAAEALFEAGISPLREAGKVSKPRYDALATAVKRIRPWSQRTSCARRSASLSIP